MPSEHFRDAAGKFARGELALLAQTQQFAPHARNDGELDADHAERHEPEPHMLHHDEEQGGERLHAEEDRRDEGVADEAADRLHLILDDGRGLGRFDRSQRLRGKPQHHGEQVEPQAPQHALAEHALGDVDPVFERAVDDDEKQEEPREAEQQPDPADLESPGRSRSMRRRASSAGLT